MARNALTRGSDPKWVSGDAEGRESMSEKIRIRLNGKDREIDDGLSVTGLLESLELNPALVVVELNREILDRDRYPETPVSGGDSLELVHFVGGG